ncbi:MAG: DNA-binding response regulator [Acidobacteria bacterium]|nr:DNA-binding response regulator [Acidobacteriota bacterium]
MPKLAILIVDDHEVVRAGLRAVLEGDPRLTVVGEADNGDEACRKTAELHPDLVVMDLSMPGLNGADATRRLIKKFPAVRVVALTAHEEPPYVRELLDAGARGYVLKRGVVKNLLRAIEVVGGGGLYLDPELAQRPRVRDAHVPQPAAELSARESDVASLAARGHANGEIAAALKISVKTVETHKAHLMVKLGLTTRAQLVRYAIYRGWLTA